MTTFAISFVIIIGLALLLIPRKWAPLPLFIGVFYMTLGPRIEIGPFTFTVIRILILVGIIRAIFRREFLSGGLIGLDLLFLGWASWGILSSLFYDDLLDSLVFRLGFVYDVCGIYFLIRVMCYSFEELILLI